MILTDLIEKEKLYYSTLKPVFCPVLNNVVHFNSDGWTHLLHKPNRRPRNVNEIYLKLMCLEFAPEVIANATGIWREREAKKDIKGIEKSIKLISLFGPSKSKELMRVVITKIGNGNFHFTSIMPHLRHKSNNKKHLK